MEPFDFYKLYLAVRLHFTSDKYDIVASRGRVNANEYKFESSKDKFRFVRLARNKTKEDAVNFLVANCSNGDNYCGVFSQDSTDVYSIWKGKIAQLEYLFDTEVTMLYYEALRNGVHDIFDCTDGHPYILKRFLGGKLSIENLVIINKICPFVDKVNQQISDDIIWGDIKRRILKYSTFLKIREYREHFIDKYSFLVSEYQLALKDVPIKQTPKQKTEYDILDIMGME